MAKISTPTQSSTQKRCKQSNENIDISTPDLGRTDTNNPLLGYNKRYVSSKPNSLEHTNNDLTAQDKLRLNNPDKLYKLIIATNPNNHNTKFYYTNPFKQIPPPPPTGARYRYNLSGKAKYQVISSVHELKRKYGFINLITLTQKDLFATNSYQYRMIQDKFIRKLREWVKYNKIDIEKFEFVWRVEPQKNSNLHTHLVVPFAIPFHVISRLWNESIIYAFSQNRLKKSKAGNYNKFYKNHLELLEKGTDTGVEPVWNTLTDTELNTYKTEIKDFVTYLKDRKNNKDIVDKRGVYKYLSYPNFSSKNQKTGNYITKDNRSNKNLELDKIKGAKGVGYYISKDNYDKNEKGEITNKKGVLIQGNSYYISNDLRNSIQINKTDYGVHRKEDLDKYIDVILTDLQSTKAFIKTYRSTRNDQTHGTIKLINDCVENLFDYVLPKSEYVSKEPPHNTAQQPPEKVGKTQKAKPTKPIYKNELLI